MLSSSTTSLVDVLPDAGIALPMEKKDDIGMAGVEQRVLCLDVGTGTVGQQDSRTLVQHPS